MSDTNIQLERIASRAIALYSRPTVAMEVVQLTEQPQVDARAIKACVEKDPALTSKILRVVNSSLYGLATPVGDLNQAIALLGIKPLKLLVLGFSLPDKLFAEVAARELQWYWTNTLTRAVAARLISERLWKQSGDEAFIAGLLQDIGILVLIRELGPPYVRFLAGAISEKQDVAALEQHALHFDHLQLTAALLARWRLPLRLIDAISAPRQVQRLAQLTALEGDLPQVLHLADLLVQLVAQRRLQVLPELMEAGAAYRKLSQRELLEVVQQLQPQVEQLASVLSLELVSDRDYVQTLADAHEQLGTLTEGLAGAACSLPIDDPAYAALWEHSRQLSEAMQAFLQSEKTPAAEQAHPKNWEHQHAAHTPKADRKSAAVAGPVKCPAELLSKLQSAGSRCRKRRQELSLLLVEPNVFDNHADPRAELAAREIRRAVDQACATLDQDAVSLVALTHERTAVVLCNCERRAAVAIAQNAIALLSQASISASDDAGDPSLTLSAGVATASAVPRNFDPTDLLESAERCLHAARTCGISTVKSIEV